MDFGPYLRFSFTRLRVVFEEERTGVCRGVWGWILYKSKQNKVPVIFHYFYFIVNVVIEVKITSHNSHHFVGYNSVIFWYAYRVVQPSPLFQDIFIIPRRKPYLLAVTRHFCFPQPLATANVFSLSLWICLFWALSINETIQYVVFCVWLLSLSIMVLRSIHIIA